MSNLQTLLYRGEHAVAIALDLQLKQLSVMSKMVLKAMYRVMGEDQCKRPSGNMSSDHCRKQATGHLTY